MRGGLSAHEHDVVHARSHHFKDVQFRLGPDPAISGFRTAGEFLLAAILVGHGLAAVVGTQSAIVQCQDGGIAAEETLPGLVKLERDSLIARSMQLQVRAAHFVDQEMIHKQLATLTDRDWRVGAAGKGAGNEQSGKKEASFHGWLDFRC